MSGRAHLALFLAVGGGIAALMFAAGGGSLYGIGFDLRWRLVDGGHVERHGLTTKSSWFRIRDRPRVVLLPGETLDVEYGFEGESGGARVEVVGTGWLRWLQRHEYLARTSRFDSPARQALRVPVERPGFYEIRSYLDEAVGKVVLDWRVRSPRPLGRLLRGAHFLGLLIVGAVLLLTVVALVMRLVRGGD